MPVRLEPMTAARFATWAQVSVAGFAAEQVASGLLPAGDATAYAWHAFERLLPHGIETPMHHLWTVWSGHEEVGHLWLRVRPLTAEVEAYVYDVGLVPAAQGRGLGRATMLAAEEQARRLRATVMRLNVFGHNTAALRLYDAVGYAVVSDTLSGPTGPGPSAADGVDLLEMDAPRLRGFRRHMRATLPDLVQRSGAMPAEDAEGMVAADVGLLLGEVTPAPGQLLWTASTSGAEVAEVWLDVQSRSGHRHAEVRWLEVPAAEREVGHGRAVTQAVLAECRRRRIDSVGVTLLGPGAAQRRICERLGLSLVARTMVKPLEPLRSA
jgi:ribosomal protein S18 acetylase RimI-like enzyme